MNRTKIFQRMFAVLLVMMMSLLSIGVMKVLAATLTLQEIGASTVGGRRISSWTYTGMNPVFSGTADPDATVSVTIASETPATVTADATGNWSYIPTTLATEGSYQVTIVSGDQTISFMLTIGSYAGYSSTTATDSAVTGTTKGGLPDTLPVSGSLENTITLMVTGLGLIAIGLTTRWLVREALA